MGDIDPAADPVDAAVAGPRPLLRRISGVQKVLSQDRRRVGTGYVKRYPSSDRIEISWAPAGAGSGGAVSVLYTRDQALQLVDEVVDLLGVAHPTGTAGTATDVVRPGRSGPL